LSDFKDPDNESKFTQPKNLGSSKPGMKKEELKDAPVIVKSEKLLSEHDYLFGKKKDDDNKIIDVKSAQDFPSLASDPIPTKQPARGGKKGPIN